MQNLSTWSSSENLVSSSLIFLLTTLNFYQLNRRLEMVRVRCDVPEDDHDWTIFSRRLLG